MTARSRWPMTALVVAVCALGTAFAPHPATLAGVGAGVVGIGAGVVGAIRARRVPTRILAVTGILLAAAAIAAGVARVSLAARAPDTAAPATGAAAVLGTELDVAIGAFGEVDSEYHWGRLPVTFTNRLAHTAEFAVAIAAFDGAGHQVDTDSVHVMLAAGCSEERGMFTVGAAEPLTAASFRIIAARRVPR